MKTAFLLSQVEESDGMAEELLLVVESWLLAIEDRSNAFREMVSLYVNARRVNDLYPLIGSSSEVVRELEWYASTHGVEDDDVVSKMDRLYGCSKYVQLKVVGGVKTSKFESWVSRIESTTTCGGNVICWEESVIAGARSQEVVVGMLKVFGEAAAATGVKFVLRKSLMGVPSLCLLGFEFSETSMVRVYENAVGSVSIEDGLSASPSVAK